MSVLTSWLASAPPDAAIEIAPRRVTVAAMTTRSGQPALQAHAIEPLRAGAVTASLASQNVHDRAAVVAAVQAAVGRLGSRAARVALVLPDVCAKVSLLHFDHVPAREDDLDQLVRWQLRKSAPFPVEDACVTYTASGRPAEGGADFLAVLAKRSVVEEYERVCAEAGLYAGLVDVTSLSVLNLLLATPGTPPGDWLAVYVRPEGTSLAIVRGGHVILFRSRHEDDEDTLADLVHQTAMYYQDRLSGQGFSRVFLGGQGGTSDAVNIVRRGLEDRLGTRVDAVDPTLAAPTSDRIGVTPDLMDVLAPLTGVLLRARSEAVAA